MKFLPLIIALGFCGLTFSIENLCSCLKEIAAEIRKLREAITNDRH